jgi:CheY-like chemotaxis protein
LGDVIEKVFKEFATRSAPPPPPPQPPQPASQPAIQTRSQRVAYPAPASMPVPQAMPAYYYAPAPAPHSPPPTPAFTDTEADLAFQAELQRSFTDGSAQTISLMRTATHQLIKADVEGARLVALSDLYKKVTSLTSNSGLCGLTQLARMSAALEALVKELQGKPASITASNIRTIAHAVDLLVVMIGHRGDPARYATKQPTVLVVDDETISRRAILYALEKANINGVGIDDPQTAPMLLSDNHFDMIFLDVDMPGMSGFELCAKIRALPDHQNTPIVFVTALTDFESRARSTLSGGNDIIAKPFIFLELTVKALTFILRAQLNQ